MPILPRIGAVPAPLPPPPPPARASKKVHPHPIVVAPPAAKQKRRPAIYKKAKIPKALRETLWLTHCGKEFEAKCATPWCQNIITVYDFQAGHRIPEVKGGATVLENLVPLCSRCNLSMGSSYTFDDWCALQQGPATAATAAAVTPRGFLHSLFSCCTASAVTPPVASPLRLPAVVVSNPAML